MQMFIRQVCYEKLPKKEQQSATKYRQMHKLFPQDKFSSISSLLSFANALIY